MTAERFDRGMDEIEATLGRLIQNFRQDVAYAIAEGVVEKTPVDLGHAKGNWQGAIGSPPTNELDVEDPIGTATLSAIRQIIDQWPPGEDFWLVNNAPYAPALEGGHSTQAPRGMVGPTLEEVSRRVFTLRT